MRYFINQATGASRFVNDDVEPREGEIEKTLAGSEGSAVPETVDTSVDDRQVEMPETFEDEDGVSS